jgi:DNA (cytosine-5)-methyltransferase 1
VNVLALCAGAGGFELGIKLAVPGARLVCACELDAFAASVLVARMADEALDQAPVWDDVRTFDGRPWRGVVDCVAAGFPCQPWSNAGKRRGMEDERWIWPDIARIIREVQPGWVFLENVPGLVHGGLGAVLADLAALGFDAEWDVFSAAQVGAPHRRERLFILGHARGTRCQGLRAEAKDYGSANASEGLADAEGGIPLFPPPRDHGHPGWAWIAEHRPDLWPNAEPDVRRMADGVAYRLDRDRLRVIGNGVVPLVAAYAWRVLAARAKAPAVALKGGARTPSAA